MLNVFKRVILRLLILLTIPLAVTSCGSGGGQSAGGGIGGTGIYAGEITDFGSVWVNGIEFFETSQSSITVDDTAALNEGDLKIGMYVTLRGTLNLDGVTGTYDSIDYDDDIEGPITDDPAEDVVSMTKTFEIFGITTIVEKNDTIFDDETGSGFNYDTIAKDDIVEVSGFINGGGALHATRIEKKGVLILGTTVVELNGTVSGFDGTNTFLSAGTGGQLKLRGPANDSSPQIVITATSVSVDNGSSVGQGTIRAKYKSSDNSSGITSTFTVRNGNNSASLTFVIKDGVVTSVTSSDRRLKKNIKLIGKSPSGINIYEFQYKVKYAQNYGTGKFQGVMSDEVPWRAVSVDKGGYDMVDYSMIDVEFKQL